MNENPAMAPASLLSRAKHEAKEIGLVTLYFLLCFSVVLMLKKLLLAMTSKFSCSPQSSFPRSSSAGSWSSSTRHERAVPLRRHSSAGGRGPV